MADDERDDSLEDPRALKPLKPRERRFVDELAANGWDQTAAARAAGYTDGPGLRATACDLMRRPHIAAAVDRVLSDLAGDARLRTEAILVELAVVGFGPATASTVGAKVRALELLGKAGKAFADRVSLENPDGTALAVTVTRRIVRAPSAGDAGDDEGGE